MKLFEIFKKRVLSPKGVIEKAIAEKLVPPNDTPEYIKSSFSDLVEQLQWDAYQIYLGEEKRAGTEAIKDYIKERLPASSSVDDVIEVVGSVFGDLDRFFLSLTQSRRPRAGMAFEVILKTLFRQLNYPFDEQETINGQPDFLMPHRKHFDVNPIDCIIFTVKRSLRERWRQIVTEGTRGLGFYLATIDEKLSEVQLDEMLKHRIHLVIPERIIQGNEIYSEAPNVISFEEFFTHHLDPAIHRWQTKGVI